MIAKLFEQLSTLSYARKIVIVLFVFPLVVAAQEEASDLEVENSIHEDEMVRIYRNPEERREAGLGRQLSEWLRVSGLVELEKEFEEFNFNSDKKVKSKQRPVSTLQLGLDASISEWLAAELTFETVNEDHQSSRIDEAFLSAEFGAWGIEAGKLTVPFGEYYSHFVTGPLLELGETRKDAVVIDYSFVDYPFELTSFVLDSEAKKRNSSNGYDWGAGLNYSSENEAIRLGFSYLSDLAESDERFLRDENDIYEKRVSAWSAYALVGFGHVEFTGEILQANRGFAEFDRNSDKPFAYNLEFAYFPTHSTQLAVRLERSDEFSDQPKQQYGISGTWRPIKNVSISAEYLHAKYKDGFILNDNAEDLDDSDLISTQLSIEF